MTESNVLDNATLPNTNKQTAQKFRYGQLIRHLKMVWQGGCEGLSGLNPWLWAKKVGNRSSDLAQQPPSTVQLVASPQP